MKKNLFVLCLLLCTTTLVRAQFGGKGAGTDSDPYQITNADELFEVRNDLLASYKMMNDVDLEQWIEEDNPTQGWSPIGNTDTPFQGTFDGNNKVIKEQQWIMLDFLGMCCKRLLRIWLYWRL